MSHAQKRTVVIAASGALALLVSLSQTKAATPYEFQISGFMSALLQMIITGEFAGRSPSNADAPFKRPVCQPGDYNDLRSTANDLAAFDTFWRRCKLVEGLVGETHVYVAAYLPPGHCETVKTAFDNIMAEHVYATPGEPKAFVEYKGSRSSATGRALARNAKLKTECRDDDSVRISAPRKPRSK